MSRTPKSMPEPVEDAMTDARMQEAEQNVQELAVITRQHSAEVSLLATQLGYDGDLSIGSIEDRIRFHQRRTVESMLEVGKGLLMLKEATLHGNSSQIGTNSEEATLHGNSSQIGTNSKEATLHGNSSQIGTNSDFDVRLGLLGFSRTSAYRFMQAASKAAKSPNLGDLRMKVKSASAFLELVMIDDEDTLKAISELDDVDRMPASELRRTLRELKANGEATDKLIAAKDKKLNELSRKGQAVGFTDGVHVFSTLIEQIDAAKRQLKASYAEIDICISAALEVEGDEVEREGMNAARIALAQCIKDALDEPERMLQKVGKRFEDTIAVLADEAAA